MMLSSCVLSIGKEIISGFTNDTNSFFISSRLTNIGIYNRFILSVDDEEGDIVSCIKACLDKVDIIITTGGLGPTFDDITVSSVAKALNKELVFSRASYNRIETFYKRLYDAGKIDSPEMNDKRKKMAYIPKGAIEIENKVGAASGIYLKENGKHIFCLPGIPKEMKPMFEGFVFKTLKGFSDSCILSKTYEFRINDETILGRFIDKLKSSDMHIKSLPTGFDSKIMGVRFTAYGKDHQDCLSKIELTKNKLQQALEQYNA